jgi:pilus assembly protein CpaE
MGALEYLPKPLTRDSVRRLLLPHFTEAPPIAEDIGAARVISVTGSRGGVGATTISANLAWHFGYTASRHTALLDPDLYMGSAAMLLDSSTGPGLRIAIEAPDRVDALFVERAAQPAADRLHVLAGEVKLAEQVGFAPECARNLLTAMCGRYAIVVVDAPFRPQPLYRDLIDLSHQRVLVAVPTLVSVRDTLRLLALPPGPSQAGRGLVVLNRAGLPGGLSLKQVESALGLKVDLVIPDQPRMVERAASMGEAMADGRNSFGRAITELARLTAFVRLLESPETLVRTKPARPWWRRFG